VSSHDPPPITLDVSRWFNAAKGFSLADLRGRPVLLHTFQLLCPGCVLHAIPQIKRLASLSDAVAVVGLHTVFEHHQAMTATVLEAFLHEYRLDHPVGVDAAVPGQTVPATMARLRLRGTPTLMLLDQQGRERHRWFGAVEDLELGWRLGQLVTAGAGLQQQEQLAAGTCDARGCHAGATG